MVDRSESNKVLADNGQKHLPSACDDPECTHHVAPVFMDKYEEPYFFDPLHPCGNCGKDMISNVYRNAARSKRGAGPVPTFACSNASRDEACKKSTVWGKPTKPHVIPS
jgi:hypothetical protein